VALRYQDLRTHYVNARYHFGDGVLHLDTRVHLDEEPFAAVNVDEKFDCSCVVVLGGAGELDGGFGQLTANVRVEVDGWGDLDHLLMTTLHGAVTLIKVHDVAVFVAEDLDLDVFGSPDVAFEEDGIVAECRSSFGPGFAQPRFEIFLAVNDAHAAAATPEGGLDDKGEADAVCGFESERGIGDGVGGAWDCGNARLFRDLSRRRLVSEELQQVGAGPDEGNAGAFAGLGQGRVLGQEAVPGMDRIDTLLGGQGNDVFDIEVRLHRAFALADLIGLVRLETVKTEAILLGVNGDGSKT
jgi:hypothetical protein